MKVKKGLISHKIGEQYIIVASEEAGKAFNGMIRSNAIRMDILRMLETDCSEEQVVESLFSLYDAPRARIAQVEREICFGEPVVTLTWGTSTQRQS